MPILVEDTAHIIRLAKAAVRKMLQEKGEDHVFPPDEIWRWLDDGVEIPSTKKQNPFKALVKEGFIEATGNITSAVSGSRAGSPTNEYRFGGALLPHRVTENVVTSTKTQPESRSADAGFFVPIPKPFIILAGISGTGKTRFVRQQAFKSLRAPLPDNAPPPNFEFIAVRPDWHEPSELLGYVSRIGGERFVPTPLLKFIVRAWSESINVATADGYTLKNIDEIVTHWVCLDEMNLAPVEQYFSDFLAVLETRSWQDGVYSCDALLPIHKLGLCQKAIDELKQQLLPEPNDGLWAYFLTHGIPLPPNLIVAGTVNMDETTHGFSRKVIDRAVTIDFGEFFPNNFEAFLAPESQPELVALRFPVISSARSVNNSDERRASQLHESVAFLARVNEELKETPFELAFRALNELLVSVHCFAPENDVALISVWDDFLMTKVLPRMEGDGDKLDASNPRGCLLSRLEETVEKLFRSKGGMATGPLTRIDLFQVAPLGDATSSGGGLAMRSLKALRRMRDRLETRHYTSFWP